MASFRNFLREQEAAPPMSMGTPPPNPDGGNSDGPKSYENVPSFMGREFNVAEKDILAAIQSGPITLFDVPNKEAEWGFQVKGPVDAIVEEINDDIFRVRFLFSNLTREKFQMTGVMPGQLVQYEGPIEDKVVDLTKGEVMKSWMKAFAGGAGGGMPPMGSAPPMGGI